MHNYLPVFILLLFAMDVLLSMDAILLEGRAADLRPLLPRLPAGCCPRANTSSPFLTDWWERFGYMVLFLWRMRKTLLPTC